MRRIVIIAAVVVVLIAAALVVAFGVLPRYDLTIAPKGQIVAAPGSKFQATVKNAGLAGGTWKEKLTVDGAAVADVTVKVKGRDTQTVELPLPDSLTAGKHTLKLGSQTLAFTALTPARLTFAKMQIDKPVVKVRDTATISLQITNKGEADGVFPGVLKVNGAETETKPAAVQGGSVNTVIFEVTQKKPRTYRVDLSGHKAKIVFVKTTRPKNGTLIKNSLTGGLGKVVFKNQYKEDVTVVLTAKAKASATSLLRLFVRGHSSTTVSGIRDGSYYVYFSRGGDWNHYNDDFLDCVARQRFPKPMAFHTSSWTSTWTQGWTIWSQRHTQYSGWNITFGTRRTDGVNCPDVSASQYPGP